MKLEGLVLHVIKKGVPNGRYEPETNESIIGNFRLDLATGFYLADKQSDRYAEEIMIALNDLNFSYIATRSFNKLTRQEFEKLEKESKENPVIANPEWEAAKFDDELLTKGLTIGKITNNSPFTVEGLSRPNGGRQPENLTDLNYFKKVPPTHFFIAKEMSREVADFDLRKLFYRPNKNESLKVAPYSSRTTFMEEFNQKYDAFMQGAGQEYSIRLKKYENR